MHGSTKRFIRENFMGLSLTCIGILLLTFSIILHFDRQAPMLVLANGNGLDGADIQSLQEINGAYERIAQAVLPSVVAIQTTQVVHVQQSPFLSDPFFRQFFGNMFPNAPQTQRERGLGSGTIISPDGYILTNNHVVRGATEIEVVLHDKRQFKGKVVGADAGSDIAVVKIDAHDLPTAVLGNSAQIHVGDQVIAFGNPYEQYFTMTRGIVSALGRSEVGAEPLPENFIQTDAAINPGNSGGALVNIRGQVVGVPTFILSGGGGPEGQGSFMGIGFAIPINEAKHVMTDLIKTGKVTRGYLGAYVGSLTPAMANEFKVPDTNGALVQDVSPGGPAAKGGLKDGDVIRTINGQSVTGSDELTIRVMNTDPGTTVTFGILRNGQPMTVRVTLGTRPANLAANAPFNQNQQQQQQQQQGPPKSGALAGVSVQNINQDIRQQLQLPSEIHGVVVTGVDQNSPAAESLGQGEVIESINRQPVANVGDFSRLASEATGQTLLRVYSPQAGGSLFIVISPGGGGE
jgi:serine protease Do